MKNGVYETCRKVAQKKVEFTKKELESQVLRFKPYLATYASIDKKISKWIGQEKRRKHLFVVNNAKPKRYALKD